MIKDLVLLVVNIENVEKQDITECGDKRRYRSLGHGGSVQPHQDLKAKGPATVLDHCNELW